MSDFVAALVIGLGVGVLYGLLGIRSPAPPLIALVGLVGMLVGEGAVLYVRGHPDVLSTVLHSKSFAVKPPEKPDRRG
jgi:XapX domain-containing protein